MSIEGEGFAMQQPPVVFVPGIEVYPGGVRLIGNNDMSARLTPDTVCSACGDRFKAGDRASARLAQDPDDAVWRHETCPITHPWVISTTGRIPRRWSPFNSHGKLNVTLYTDPWWKRLWAKVRRQPVWHQTGALRDD